MQKVMSDADLERAYDLIAEAIDRAGPARESPFLARLALTLSAQLPSVEVVIEAIRAAEQE